MAEWPKLRPVQMDPDELDGRWGQTEKVEVIPADLGRELYEALKIEVAFDCPDDPDIGPRALARYEQEVN